MTTFTGTDASEIVRLFGSDIYHNGGLGVAPELRLRTHDVSMGGGNDTVYGSGGNGRLDGGAGIDTLQLIPPDIHSISSEVEIETVGPFSLTIDLQQGYARFDGYQDVIFTTPEATFHLGAGTLAFRLEIENFENVRGSAGNDTIRGSDVDFQRYWASAGNDVFNGRGGFDTVSYIIGNGLQIAVNANLSRGVAYTSDGGEDRLVNIEGLEGSNLGDRLTGNENANIIEGYAGADILDGRGGIDLLDYALSGNSATGLRSGHTLSGVIVDLARGFATDPTGWRDTLRNFENVRGTVRDDVIDGDRGANRLIGMDGADRLDGRGGADRLEGGAGNDALTGGGGADTLLGDAGDDTLNGDAGDDVFFGGEGTDIVVGGRGQDRLDFSFAATGSYSQGVNVRLKSNYALDMWGNEEEVRGIEDVTGTDLRDIINGDNRANVLLGGGGRDNIGGLGGNDTLRGGAGQDQLGGGNGRDLLFGGDDADTVFGGNGRDRIFGEGGNDRLFGGNGADLLVGGADEDELRDSRGEINTRGFVRDLLDRLADSGGDAVTLASEDQRINWLDGGEGRDTVLGCGLLVGGDGNDTIRGTGVLAGGAGNDRLFADASFDDTITGSDPAEAILMGGLGRDILTGDGGGQVTAAYTYAQQGVVVRIARQVVIAGQGDRDQFEGIDRILGSSHADRFHDTNAFNGQYFGGAGADIFTLQTGTGRLNNGQYYGDEDYADGGQGADRFVATGGGRARIFAGAGNDVIEIGSEYAWVIAGTGNDQIIGTTTNNGFGFDSRTNRYEGNGGNDTFHFTGGGFANLFGGAGNDTFILENTQDYFYIEGGSGRDVYDIRSVGDDEIRIGDFERRLDLLDIGAVLAPGDRNIEALRNNAEQDGNDVVIRLINGGTLVLEDFAVADLTARMFDFG